MSNELFDEIVQDLVGQFGSASIEVNPQNAPVPDAWKSAALQNTRHAITSLFEPLKTSLPRFFDYVAKQAESIRVGVCGGRGALLVAFPDWNHSLKWGFSPGIMVAGVPREEGQLSTFEAVAGYVPASLRAVWHSFSYVTLKDSGCLLDFAETDRHYYSCGVDHLGLLNDFDDPTLKIDSLRIIRVNGQVSYVLVRSADPAKALERLASWPTGGGVSYDTAEFRVPVFFFVSAEGGDWTLLKLLLPQRGFDNASPVTREKHVDLGRRLHEKLRPVRTIMGYGFETRGDGSAKSSRG